jgi:hypothetical protein
VLKLTASGVDNASTDVSLTVCDTAGTCTDPYPTLNVAGGVSPSDVAIYDTTRASPLIVRVQYSGNDSFPRWCEEIEIGLGSAPLDVTLFVEPCQLAVGSSCPTCGEPRACPGTFVLPCAQAQCGKVCERHGTLRDCLKPCLGAKVCTNNQCI